MTAFKKTLRLSVPALWLLLSVSNGQAGGPPSAGSSHEPKCQGDGPVSFSLSPSEEERVQKAGEGLVHGRDARQAAMEASGEVRDLYADTWVATDALGRALPGYDQCGPPRANKKVALFYFIWHGEHGTAGPFDITRLLAANPTNPSWGPRGRFHHWGQPELGYYLSSDEYVIRKHAHMIANAGVDVIVFDVTNTLTYTNNYLKVCRIFREIRAQGGTTPQICFLANSDGVNVAQTLYNDFYSQKLYPELWFYFKGKPLIMAPLKDGRNDHRPEVQEFFTLRYAWTWMAPGRDTWKWMDEYPQQYGWHESPDQPEQLSVSVGIVPHGEGMGRSFHQGSQPPHDQYGRTGTEDQGLCFAEQWSRLKTIDPELLFITGWNEWVAQRQVFRGSGDPVSKFIGRRLGPGDTWFIDAYNQEFSRDIEPMKGGHTDNYYYQMIDGIRRYKGIRIPESPSPAKRITIDGKFADWDDVRPEYRDWLHDTMHRNHPGWGAAGAYTNTTGRNDFAAAKIARDDTYVYFYVETAEAITPRTDPNWMLLFINADRNAATGWEGYDYAVNLSVQSDTLTTLKATRRGWNWTNVNAAIAYRVSGRTMELQIPRNDIGQGRGSQPVALDFHWADNTQPNGGIIQLSISGDSAPDRRFNYRYETR